MMHIGTTDLRTELSQSKVESLHKASSFSFPSNHSFRSNTTHFSSISTHISSLFFTLVPNNHSFRSRQQNHLLAQGQTQGSMLQQCTNKNLTTDPFDNTCEVDEVSPEVEAGVVTGLKCLQP
jgi:hypothetical protein